MLLHCQFQSQRGWWAQPCGQQSYSRWRCLVLRGPKVFCEDFRTLKITLETLRESNIWYWTSMVVYSSAHKPALRSCCELIHSSGQLWIYSRRVWEECARVHVNLQNRNTRELWYSLMCIWCHPLHWQPYWKMATNRSTLQGCIWRQNASRQGSVRIVQLL